MRYGLYLNIIAFIFFTSFLSFQKPQSKEIIYVDKPITLIKEVIKIISPVADTVIIPSGLPVQDKMLKKSLHSCSGFGTRIHPISKKLKFHSGIDIGCPSGTDVLSTASGKVIRIQYSKTGYGNNIVIEHSNKYKTLYAHLKNISVKVNQRISKGQVIGYSGSTGTSTNPHLHYEVIVNNKKVNPIGFMST